MLSMRLDKNLEMNVLGLWLDLRVIELVDANIKGGFGPVYTNNLSTNLKDLGLQEIIMILQ